MKYFFILGTNPTLSVAELIAVIPQGKNAELTAGGVFIWETATPINTHALMKKLGGVIKIGEILSVIETRDFKNFQEKLIGLININNIKGKFNFGISCYSSKKTSYKINLKKAGMEIKKYLREKNITCRWVTSREPVLSSVVVEQNKLLPEKGGVEIVLIENKNEILIGRTLKVQLFKELSARDYGRPARDDRSGMLPPKLAQIMINLATPSPYQGEGWGEVTLLDPFCGSGTILTEAMLMGYKNLTGSDISQKAIDDTEKNINWVIARYKIQDTRYKLFNSSSIEISKKLLGAPLTKGVKGIAPGGIDAIITEPYLGPQRGTNDADRVIKDLEKLYSESLNEFSRILKPNGRVVMIWPIFTEISKRLNIILKDFKIVNPIPENLLKNKLIKLTDRHTIIYGREGQKVWREIVVLRKK